MSLLHTCDTLANELSNIVRGSLGILNKDKLEAREIDVSPYMCDVDNEHVKVRLQEQREISTLQEVSTLSLLSEKASRRRPRVIM